MSNVNFTIRISSQNGEPSTHKVVCDIHNTIGELRRLIQTTHPSCPDPLDQKLIFMGQLWKNNEEILKNNLKMVYDPSDPNKEYVIWLIISGASALRLNDSSVYSSSTSTSASTTIDGATTVPSATFSSTSSSSSSSFPLPNNASLRNSSPSLVSSKSNHHTEASETEISSSSMIPILPHTLPTARDETGDSLSLPRSPLSPTSPRVGSSNSHNRGLTSRSRLLESPSDKLAHTQQEDSVLRGKTNERCTTIIPTSAATTTTTPVLPSSSSSSSSSSRSVSPTKPKEKIKVSPSLGKDSIVSRSPALISNNGGITPSSSPLLLPTAPSRTGSSSSSSKHQPSNLSSLSRSQSRISTPTLTSVNANNITTSMGITGLPFPGSPSMGSIMNTSFNHPNTMIAAAQLHQHQQMVALMYQQQQLQQLQAQQNLMLAISSNPALASSLMNSPSVLSPNATFHTLSPSLVHNPALYSPTTANLLATLTPNALGTFTPTTVFSPSVIPPSPLVIGAPSSSESHTNLDSLQLPSSSSTVPPVPLDRTEISSPLRSTLPTPATPTSIPSLSNANTPVSPLLAAVLAQKEIVQRRLDSIEAQQSLQQQQGGTTTIPVPPVQSSEQQPMVSSSTPIPNLSPSLVMNPSSLVNGIPSTPLFTGSGTVASATTTPVTALPSALSFAASPSLNPLLSMVSSSPFMNPHQSPFLSSTPQLMGSTLPLLPSIDNLFLGESATGGNNPYLASTTGSTETYATSLRSKTDKGEKSKNKHRKKSIDTQSNEETRFENAKSKKSSNRHHRSHKKSVSSSSSSSAVDEPVLASSKRISSRSTTTSTAAITSIVDNPMAAVAGARVRLRRTNEPSGRNYSDSNNYQEMYHYSSDEEDNDDDIDMNQAMRDDHALPPNHPGEPPVQPPIGGADGAAMAAEQQPVVGLRRYINIGEIVRLCLVSLVFFQGASQEKMIGVGGFMVFIYFYRVGLVNDLQEFLRTRFCCGCCNRGLHNRAAGGGDGDNMGINNVENRNRIDGRPPRQLPHFMSNLLFMGQGWFIMDILAMIVAFFLSLLPSFIPDHDLPTPPLPPVAPVVPNNNNNDNENPPNNLPQPENPPVFMA